MRPSEEPDWYLREWLDHFDKLQVDLEKDLGWPKNSAHRRFHSVQPYRRDLVNQVAEWLNIKPYELLMPPAEALALRRLRESAAQIVKAGGAHQEPGSPFPIPLRKTGTDD